MAIQSIKRCVVKIYPRNLSPKPPIFNMLRIVEQKYLLKMLENNRQFPTNKRPDRSNFHKIMASMVKKKLVEIKERNNGKVYRLTTLGWGRACLIAKEFDTPPQYKKHARVVELWIM